MKKTYLNTLKYDEIIKRLKNGEIIHSDSEETFIKMVDGICVKIFINDGACNINPYIVSNSEYRYYFEDKEPFAIIKTGKYRTRDGRIAYVSYIEASCVGCIDGYDDIVRWSIEGIPFYKDHNRDLVEYIGD